jgi:hypothetical protein
MDYPGVSGSYVYNAAFAASGLAIVIILAAVHHIRKNEYKKVGFKNVLLILPEAVANYR